MAVFQLGALVTEIVGSIGGTTFKRQGTSRVMMKKSNGASRSTLLQNPRLGINSTIFKKWSTLSAPDQRAWSNLASENTVKDRFGNDIYLSGVNFQRRCDLSVMFLNETPDPYAWSSLVAYIAFAENPLMNWTHSTLKIKFNIEPMFSNIALMLEYSLNPLQEPVFISRGVWYHGMFENGVTVDLFDEFFIQFPFLNEAYNLRLYAYAYTSSGVLGTIIQSNILLEL